MVNSLDIPLDFYKIFCTVIRTGNMSLAAKELFISQPAVSMSVKQLEERLGKPLLVRSSKGIKPTAEGELIYEYLSQAMNFIKTAEQKYLEMSHLQAGEIRIGASDTILSHYLLPYIKEYIGLYPNINIKVTNRTTYDTISLLKSGQVDIGFVNLPVEQDDNLEVYECIELQDVLVGGSKFRKYASLGFNLTELSTQPLMLFENDSNSRRYLDSFVKSQGVTLKPYIELGSYELLIKFAINNIGLTFAVKEFLGEVINNEDLFLIPLVPEIPPRAAGMVKLRDVALSYAAAKFRELISY